uniref:Uncharacterized protein n=1 Tax=Vespula pensylvanica TaxID=30213 RepID=A0A834U3Z3_VESPE|nr:hypothetical protein H0235_012015 [Vespula pensylvanica]
MGLQMQQPPRGETWVDSTCDVSKSFDYVTQLLLLMLPHSTCNCYTSYQKTQAEDMAIGSRAVFSRNWRSSKLPDVFIAILRPPSFKAFEVWKEDLGRKDKIEKVDPSPCDLINAPQLSVSRRSDCGKLVPVPCEWNPGSCVGVSTKDVRHEK